LKKFFYLLISVFALFYQTSLFAKDTDELNALLNRIKNIEADFTQTIVNTKHQVLQKGKGRMMLERPGKFRWEMQKPNAQWIVTNGEKLWIYDPDLEQVTIRKLTRAAGEAPALLLSHTTIALAKDFEVRKIKAAANEEAYLLFPRDKSSALTQIKFVFRKEDISRIELQDHLGNTTIIQFTNLKTPAAFSPNLFIFKVPRQVDVIDETQLKK